MPAAPTVTDTAEIKVTVAGEWEEPNNVVAQATPFAPDTLAIGHIASKGDVDLYSVSVPSTGKLSAFLSGLPADFDLVLYGPPAPTLRGVPTRTLKPVDDTGPLLANDSPGAAEVGGDQPLVDLPIVAVSQNRGTTAERIESTTLRPGTYILQVTGYNGATSNDSYVLRSAFNPTAAPAECKPWEFPGGAPASGEQGTLAADASFDGADTVFVVNRQRMVARFGDAAKSALASIDSFVTAAASNPKLGVSAKVAYVDGDPEVRSAYDTWDTGANRCSPESARAVTSSIGKVVDRIRAADRSLRNVVIIGGDDVIPFGRVLDTTKVANESDYASTFADNNELSSAMRDGYVLTDDPYGSSNPLQVGRGELFAPELAVGRLVETPSEISGALDDFVRFGGSLNASTAAVAGYDFLSDGASAVADSLERNGLKADRLINDAWSAGDLGKLVLGSSDGSAPDVASVNAHFDHYRALPASENSPAGGFDESKLFGLRDLDAAGSRRLERSLLFSMGCHSGLSVSDTTGGALGADWAQRIARQGGIWVGNTGFGYGDSDPGVVALSEELMSQFAKRLDGTMTIGRALQLAKQRYVADRGDTITGYDSKVAQEATFYGLPMYRLDATLKSPPAQPTSPATAVEPRVGLSASASDLNFPVGPDAGGLAQQNSDRGTYWSVDGDVWAVQNRPLQPRASRDVTVANDDGSLRLDARGGLVTALTSRDVAGVDPVIHRPTVDLASREPEPTTVDNQFPASLTSVGTAADLVGRRPDGSDLIGPRQRLVVTPGQFRGAPDSSKGTQRLFTSMAVTTYYADPTDADRTPPVISDVVAEAGTLGGFTVRAGDGGDASRIKRVYVLATDADNPGTWFGGDLVRGEGDAWRGGISLPPDVKNIDYFVQVVDASGNVSTSSNKVANFRSTPPPPPEGDPPTVVPPPGLAADGWSAGPVALGFTGTSISVSIDGKPAATVDGPVTVTGEGQHTVLVTDAQGRSATFSFRIDTTPPAVSCAAVGADWSANNVSVPCTAADEGVGLAPATEASLLLVTDVADGTETAAAATSTQQVCDLIGNCATAGPVTAIHVDRRAPEVSVTTPETSAKYTTGQVVRSAFACSDAGSGIVSCAGPGATSSGSLVDTSKVGVHEFVVTARDGVGRESTATRSYEVIAPPSNKPPVVKADLGSGIHEVGFFGHGSVRLSGSFSDADGPGPLTASIQWGAGAPFKPLVVDGSNLGPNTWAARHRFKSADVVVVTIKVCDATGACGQDSITVHPSVITRVTPLAQRLGHARFLFWKIPVVHWGYDNAAGFAVVVPRGDSNCLSVFPWPDGQPTLFLPGRHDDVFTSTSPFLPVTWNLTGVSATASSLTPRVTPNGGG